MISEDPFSPAGDICLLSEGIHMAAIFDRELKCLLLKAINCLLLPDLCQWK